MNYQTIFVTLLVAAGLMLSFAPGLSASEQSPSMQPTSEQSEIAALIDKALQAAEEGDIAAAKRSAKDALARARELGESELLRDALMTNAGVHEQEGNYYLARKLYREALPYYESSNDRLVLAEVLSALGACNGHLSDNDLAVTRFEAALKIYEEQDVPEGITFTLNNIAVIYDNIGNDEKELEYYQKALRAARQSNLPIGESVALANIGAVHADEKEYEKALEYLLPALELAEAEADHSLVIYILTELGTINLEKEAFEQAHEQIGRSLELARASGYGKDEFRSLLLLAEIEAALGNYSRAFQLANECDELIHKLDLLVEANDTLLLRSKIYAYQQNYRKAYELLKEYQELEIAAQQEETEEMIHEMQARFDTERKENEIALLNNNSRLMNLELKAQRSTQLFLIAGLLLSFLLIGLAVYSIRSKARANKEIEEKNDALSRAYSEMEKLAKTDPLTGLINRRAFYELLNYEHNRHERTGSTHSFIIADIDFFKKINDSRGHETGDQVLAWVADMMKDTIRKQDVLGRWGGEEFLFFLPETTAKGAASLAEKIRTAVEQSRYAANGDSLSVSLTFGIAEWRPGSLPRDVIHLADEALYFGKSQGRNCVNVYSGKHHTNNFK